MKPAPPDPRDRPYGKWLCALGAIFAAGVVAATAATSSAAPLDDCLLPLPLTCPTVSAPTVPPISVPLPLPATTTTPTTTSATPTTPSPTPNSTSPAPNDVDPAAHFSYTVVQISARRIGSRRQIVLRLSLSHAAMVVAVLHRSGIPSLVAIRAGRPGANTFAVAVPTRIRAGRHTLKLVLGTGAEQHTFTRRISVPK